MLHFINSSLFSEEEFVDAALNDELHLLEYVAELPNEYTTDDQILFVREGVLYITGAARCIKSRNTKGTRFVGVSRAVEEREDALAIFCQLIKDELNITGSEFDLDFHGINYGWQIVREGLDIQITFDEANNPLIHMIGDYELGDDEFGDDYEYDQDLTKEFVDGLPDNKDLKSDVATLFYAVDKFKKILTFA